MFFANILYLAYYIYISHNLFSMKNIYILRLGIVCILLTNTIPASASNYSSPGEAFVVGALSYVLFSIISF